MHWFQWRMDLKFLQMLTSENKIDVVNRSWIEVLTKLYFVWF